jgi:hypothetical protein
MPTPLRPTLHLDRLCQPSSIWTMESKMDEAEIPVTAGELAVRRSRRENEAFLRQLEQDGWQWRASPPGGRVLEHPKDPDLNVYYSLISGEVLVSPKLAERAKESFRRENPRPT